MPPLYVAVEDLADTIAINLEVLNNIIKQDPKVIVDLLDQDGNGKMSSEDVKKDLEEFEGAIDMTPVKNLEVLNELISQNALKLLDVAEKINNQ